jgi:hypothetical protein
MQKCNACYEYSCEGDEVHNYNFIIGNLRACFYPTSQKFYLDKEIPSSPKSEGKMKSFKELLSFDFIPNITPNNLLQRYKTLVTFS